MLRRSFVNGLLFSPAIINATSIMSISTKLDGYRLLRQELIKCADYSEPGQIRIDYVDGITSYLNFSSIVNKEIRQRVKFQSDLSTEMIYRLYNGDGELVGSLSCMT